MMEAKLELAVRNWVLVDASAEWAFDVFTRDVETWWPCDTHSIRADLGLGRPEALVLEPWEGGRFYERTGQAEFGWATVTGWDPPRRLVLEWHLEADLPPTEVEVTFTPEDENTRVELAHTGWEFVGPTAKAARSRYAGSGGWEPVLRCYAEAVGS
jgi:uncharacterized protein YndB with AHSA1/START domain